MALESQSGALDALQEQRSDQRVSGLDCSVEVTLVDDESAALCGTIHNECEDGMAILVDDMGNIETGAEVVVSDFDGHRLAEIRHVSDYPGGQVMGIAWRSPLTRE